VIINKHAKLRNNRKSSRVFHKEAALNDWPLTSISYSSEKSHWAISKIHEALKNRELLLFLTLFKREIPNSFSIIQVLFQTNSD
jgi:hypothetical protein